MREFTRDARVHDLMAALIRSNDPLVKSIAADLIKSETEARGTVVSLAMEIEEDEDNGSSLLESYKKRSSSLNSRLSAQSREGRHSFKLNASGSA